MYTESRKGDPKDFFCHTLRTTIFENVWNQPEGHLFKSEEHGVMAVADKFPRMPLQVVVALSEGTPGVDQHFQDLELVQQRRLLEVGMVVSAKILRHCNPGQRSMFTLEGFAVPDHVHIVHYAGERRQGIDRYDGRVLGQRAVEKTLELVAFTSAEVDQLESRLDSLG